MNPGQPVGRIITYDFVDGTLEYRPDRAAGAMMHPVPQFEIAERKFGVINMEYSVSSSGSSRLVMLPDFAVEPLQRLEEVPLVSVIERLAEVQILQLAHCGSDSLPDR